MFHRILVINDAAVAGERAAWNQYQMALDGAQIQDRESARSLVNAAKGTVEEVAALLQDARLTAPESGQISTIFPKRGELVGAGMPIMNLIVLDDVHIVLNVREDCLPFFPMGGTFVADIPAIDKKNIEFKINYVSLKWTAIVTRNIPLFSGISDIIRIPFITQHISEIT